jgi:prevent-host-death family protein
VTNRVHYTGEPVIVEKQGEPFVALVSLEDFETLRRLKAQRDMDEFTRLAAAAAAASDLPDMTEDEIVQAVKVTRAEMYRERYGES